jgi:hypothetical protein
MRSLPAGLSGKPEANPAEAPPLQLFLGSRTYLRKAAYRFPSRVAATTGTVPVEITLCTDPAGRQGYPLISEAKISLLNPSNQADSARFHTIPLCSCIVLKRLGEPFADSRRIV